MPLSSSLLTRPARSFRAGGWLASALVLLAPGVRPASADGLGWPVPTNINKPWTRWWWLGSAVDEPNLGRLLNEFSQAGLGGVEICPIYGAKGYEAHFLPYLSKGWVDQVDYAITEGKRLGLGVDLTTGTGWPLGGPWVTPSMASESTTLRQFAAAGGDTSFPALPKGRVQAMVAVSDDGRSVDLTAKVQEGQLRWTAPVGNWTVYAVFARGPAQQVKRSAPGGEGSVLDPFSPEAMTSYTDHIDEAFRGTTPQPRAQFHDSYEYYGATWTPPLFDEFKARRGYDLRTQLPALLGAGDADVVARVKYDYRQTLSELHQAYIQRWTDWSHRHGSLSREQAHGSPTNIEDTYAIADIPETEVFGEPVDAMGPMARFASSAAHLTGKPLASSETFTWLGEHFQVPLSSLKVEADDLFLWGINHILFHGTPYSPADAPWPGWQFYAAVNFGPEGGLWHDLPGFLRYATRCQSILQANQPSSDVLLYFPLADYWQNPDGLLRPMLTDGKWMHDSPFHDSAMALTKQGYAFEQVTDALLSHAEVRHGLLTLGGGRFQTVVVPACRVMPAATFEHLVALAKAGATVAFTGGFPRAVPGLKDKDIGGARLASLVSDLGAATTGSGVRVYPTDSGRILVGPSLEAVLSVAQPRREAMADLGLAFIRRERPDGMDYFIVNRSPVRVDRWVPLATGARSAVILDPMSAERLGTGEIQPGDTAAKVYLQLDPGESCFVRTSRAAAGDLPAWHYEGQPGPARELVGPWSVTFIDGGPAMPEPFASPKLGYWTGRDDPKVKTFSGTARYRLDFSATGVAASDWRLDLGKVAASARVRLNGQEIAVAWNSPFFVRLSPALREGTNHLEIDVTNLAANRIADLDRRGVRWKSFYEINIVNVGYTPFDAANWPVMDSGLAGPVTLRAIPRLAQLPTP